MIPFLSLCGALNPSGSHPVGRLDKASEGLLLMTNDSEWAAGITAPESHLDKTYHVQIGAVADDNLFSMLRRGVESQGEVLHAKRVSSLRAGEKNSWIEVVLDEGKNRQIRRMLASLGIEVLRLVRVSIGPLTLGDLKRGATRRLTSTGKICARSCAGETRQPFVKTSGALKTCKQEREPLPYPNA